eukprot:GHVN01098853.1.p1 GENE.GHVN01098853.1~~GHVN01098853.1.p1  ORF type:complete len:172 (-),score=10.91 GHVN01098853.1:395-910(-)
MRAFLIDSSQICVYIGLGSILVLGLYRFKSVVTHTHSLTSVGYIGSFFTLLNIATFIVFVFDKWVSRQPPSNGPHSINKYKIPPPGWYPRHIIPQRLSLMQPRLPQVTWRVSERTLLLLAAIGGSMGAKLAQRMVRHKTQKQPFGYLLSAICVSQTVLCIGLLYLYLFIFI